jgi:tetratricopeptide (TPR) repeat protein
MRFCSYKLALLGAAALSASAHGQHPMEVQRHSADAEHLAALVTYDRLPRRVVSSASRVAAGRSAWALSLPERALEDFERAALDPELDPIEHARIHLSAGIVHFQEGRYQIAVVKAEKATELIATPGPLRSKAWFLWAESLQRLGSLGVAAERYGQALAEAAPEDRPEIHYALGLCERRLGKFEAAREHFEKVPLRHERTPMAIRQLAEVSLEMKNYPSVTFWLARGRTEYPEQFIDSWVDYALVRAAISRGALDEVRELRTEATGKYPPADGWLTLLNAAAESFEWHVSKQ